jgi:choline dehydrogenase-like flavoprotein
MYNAEVHVRLAEKTGNVRVMPETRVVRIHPSRRGQIGSVSYLGPDRVVRQQTARLYVLAAHTIESVRLLLLSACAEYPLGLANDHDLVGRFFMEHFGAGMTGLYRENLFPYRIGFNTAYSLQFYNTPQRNRIGAIKLTFAAGGETPAQIAAKGPRWGIPLKDEIRRSFGRSVSVVANIEQLPHRDNRIALDASLRDEAGFPAPEIHLTLGNYEKRTLRHARGVITRILHAMEARILWSSILLSLRNERHPIAHHMGGCRMGEDPAQSVVDKYLRVHGIDNLFVVGSSVFPTGGAVNPTLTIAALALRAATSIRESLAHLVASPSEATRS